MPSTTELNAPTGSGAQGCATASGRNGLRQPAWRSIAQRSTLALLAAASLSLAGCGGGVEVSVPPPPLPFSIGVSIGGSAVTGLVISPGTTQDVTMSAGQSISLDANEPVAWSLEVGGSQVAGDGITVYYGGAAITQTAVSSSSIVVDTAAPSGLVVPVTFTFVATSTLDATQVATVKVTLTN